MYSMYIYIYIACIYIYIYSTTPFYKDPLYKGLY